MLKKIVITMASIGALMVTISVMNTFAAHEKCPRECKCPQDASCKKDCEEGNTDTCTCKH